MPPPGQLPELSRRLRRGLAADLSGVRIDFVRGLPWAAFAWGDRVVVSDRLLQAEPATLLHVVAHELVHVFQQRAGRARPNVCAARLPGCYDAELEAEAERGAARVVAGARLDLARAPRAPRAAPVLQPLITVGGQSRIQLDAFSTRFQEVLPLIAGGPQWLQWALNLAGPAFYVDSEEQLVAQIQFALHGSRVAVFQSAGLRLAPELLLPLPDPDFGNVVSSLQTGQLTPAAQSALTASGVRTEADFSELDQVLASLGVSGQLAVQPLDLADQVGLYELLVARNGLATENSVNCAAASFAATVAQNAADFGAAFSFYLAAAMAQPAADPATISALWTALTPLTLNYLRCPSVPREASDRRVLDTLSTYLNLWPFLGFQTCGSAIYNCGAHSGLDLSQATVPSSAANTIGLYMLRAKSALQQTIKSANPRVTRCQDGVVRWYQFDNSDGARRILLDGAGCLTLLDFVPR